MSHKSSDYPFVLYDPRDDDGQALFENAQEGESAARAYVEGRNAFNEGTTYTACPYPEESIEGINWHVGFEDAFCENQ